MDRHRLLSELLELAEGMGIVIRRMPAVGAGSDHPGGSLVRLRGQEMLFLNPTAGVADQVDAAAAALVGREELERQYLPPEIRETIERAGRNAGEPGREEQQ